MDMYVWRVVGVWRREVGVVSGKDYGRYFGEGIFEVSYVR